MAIHYVSNGRWVNVTKLTNQGVVHHAVSRDALLQLYKGSDTGLGLVINTLDVVAEPTAPVSNPAAWHKVKSEEEACKLWNSFDEMLPRPSGTFLESEVILLPGRGDSIVQDTSKTTYLNCPSTQPAAEW